MRIYLIDEDIKELKIDDVDFESKYNYWFDMTPEELKDLNNSIFRFLSSTIMECESASQLAKVDFYDDYIFLVLNCLKYENGVVNADEFNILLGRKYIITVSKDEVKMINELKKELINYKGSVFFLSDKSPTKMLYYLLDKLILNDYEIINNIENVMDSLEIQIMKNPNKQFLNALLHLRHQVHSLRRCTTPLRYIGDNLLCNENNIIEPGYLKNFSKINTKIDKLMLSVESLVQYIILVREAFEAEMSNKTNELIKLFTIFSMFFSPLYLITGIYGMNFIIPEFRWQFGYLYVIILMIAVSVALFLYFKKRKWL